MGRGLSPLATLQASLGSTLKRWLKLWVQDIDCSGVITDGSNSSSVANLRNATKIQGKPINQPTTYNTFPLYIESGPCITWVTRSTTLDRQRKNATGTTSTTSLTPIILPADTGNMELTTASGVTRTYNIHFNCEATNTNADKIHTFALYIGGVEVMRRKSQSGKNPLETICALHWQTEVAPSTTIAIYFCTDANTISVRRRHLSIWGEP